MWAKSEQVNKSICHFSKKKEDSENYFDLLVLVNKLAISHASMDVAVYRLFPSMFIPSSTFPWNFLHWVSSPYLQHLSRQAGDQPAVGLPKLTYVQRRP